MGVRKYSDAQILWLEVNGTSNVWKNRDEFREAFNKTFGTNIGVYTFNNLIDYYKIKICTRQTESLFTDEQREWLIENAKSGRYKNCRHLTETYNALFKDCRKPENIIGYLFHWGVSLNSQYKELRYTDEMESWMRSHYEPIETINDFAREFNELFHTQKSAEALASHCRKLGLKRKPTNFVKGRASAKRAELYTIRSRKGRDWIKVNMNGDKSDWMPLHKYVWEQHYGKVPEGYCVVFLTDNQKDVSLSNLALIDRRATPTMAKLGWWTDNKVITADGVQWCNLYCVAKDNGIDV